MKEVIEKFFCDICGEEKRECELKKRTLPVLTGGRYIVMHDVEACEDCSLKVTNLECGCRGTNIRFIRED